MAVAIVLLVGAGLLARSFVSLQTVDLGFEVHLPPVRYDESAARVRFHHAYQDRLRAVPGVEAVGATSWLPANGHYHEWGYGYLDAAGERQWTGAMVRVIDGAYFEALGIPLLHGRLFTRDDDVDAEDVAIISQSIAGWVYGEQGPLGEIFRTGGRNFTVVGVVGNVAYEADGTGFGKAYVSHGQFADDRQWGLTYVVKTTPTPTTVIEPARQALAATDEALVLYRARTMTDLVSRHRAQTQFTLLLMVLFAGIAVTLAAVGVYGVLAYTVSQRTQEIGVRMALSARPEQVRATVLRHGALVAGAGIACGLTGALGLSRFLAALTFEVSAQDPTVFIVVALRLGAIVLGASYVPARRATRVDPLTALRSEQLGLTRRLTAAARAHTSERGPADTPSRSGSPLRRHWINHPPHLGHGVGGEPAALGMLLDERLVVGDIHTEGLVAREIGVFPLDVLALRLHLGEHRVRLLRSPS